jgi:hypothetical protein
MAVGPTVLTSTTANTVSRPRPQSAAVEALAATASATSNQSALICQMMRELPYRERAEVLRSLHAPTSDEICSNRRVQTSRHWVVRFLALCCLGLIPWTIGLAVTLPRTYLVGNWPLAWTGFDAILLGCLSTTAWALWKQRQIAVPASMVTCVLLACDAWFDVVTARGGHCLIVSLATAVFAELPLAALLCLISVRLLHAGVRVARGLEPDAASQALWRTPLITSAEASGSSAGSRRGEGGAAPTEWSASEMPPGQGNEDERGLRGSVRASSSTRKPKGSTRCESHEQEHD